MQKDFASTNVNVASSMIWGCQWDQVMKFVDDKQDGAGNTFDVTTPRTTEGSSRHASNIYNTNDKVQNIYDLEGNVFEWTLEAYNTYVRVPHGGQYDNRGYSAYRDNRYDPCGSYNYSREPCHTLYKKPY